MNNAYRTITRCACYAGIVGCLLAGTSTLVHAQDYPPYYSQASRVHIAATYARQQSIASGTAVVPVNTSARWTSPDDSITRYRTSTINVPKSSLRIGALSAMSRGIMHPGWQAALLAAGYIYSQSQLSKKEEIEIVSEYIIPDDGSGFTTTTSSSDVHASLIDACMQKGPGSNNRLSTLKTIYYSGGPSATCRWIDNVWGNYIDRQVYKSPLPATHPPIMDEPFILTPVDVEDIDFTTVDPHIPPSLYDELWNGEPIPEWQDTISILGSPATGVSSDGALAPELADAVGRWGENMDAQYNGEEAPHTDHPTTGNTPQDQVAEEVLDGEVPPFPDLDIEWQTETLELPSYSSGIGQGSCPAGATIPLPLGAGPLQFSYQPACDLATMVRPALIGICGLIALMIVLRARGGA